MLVVLYLFQGKRRPLVELPSAGDSMLITQGAAPNVSSLSQQATDAIQP